MSQRYFVEKLNGVIDHQDAHHMIKVMRMKDQDEIIVCSKQTCILASIEIKDKQVLYKEIKKLDYKTHFDVTIIQGLPKKNKMEFVSKYATVYGAASLYFCGMDRSIVKLENDGFKKERLTAIAKEAAELAHRSFVPEVMMFQSLKHIDFNLFDVVIVADEDEHMVEINTLLPLDMSKKYAVIIGPEGGISEQERKYFKSINAHFITLGHYILPTESASLSVLSFFMHQNHKLF